MANYVSHFFLRTDGSRFCDLRKHGLLFFAVPTGVEPVISWMKTRRPRPLDDGTNSNILRLTGLKINLRVQKLTAMPIVVNIKV